MRRLLDTIRKEPLFTLMFVIVVLVFATMAFLKPQPASQDSDTTMMMLNSEAQLTEMIAGHELLFAGMSIIFLGFVTIGLLIDVLVIDAYRKGERLGRLNTSDVHWLLSDVVKAFILLFFSEVLILILMVPLLMVLQIGADDQHLLLMVTTFLRNIVVAIYLIRVVQRVGSHFSALGLTLHKVWRKCLAGIVTYIGFFPIYFFILINILWVLKLLGYEPPVQTVAQIIYEEQNQHLLIFFSVFVALIGPIFEELFFRGFVYQALRCRLNMWRAAVLISVIFAILHADLVAMLPIFALSMVLTLLFEKTRSIVACSALHVTHNLISLTILFQMKALA